MGASGSGKTTLLHALAGRSQNTSMEGSIYFDDLDPAPFYVNGSCGYVQQHDYLIPYLSVRLPRSMSIQEKYEMVESVINELGEKRRVSVGCQLLLNPSILFLDEPTTGLDAYTSFNLVETLKGLSRRGRTIFITIHQPRSDIANLFDTIILLSKGQLAYAGQAGTTMLDYFSSLGHHCPENVNPADFVIDITSIDNRTEQSEQVSLKRVNALTRSWSEKLEKQSYHQLEFQILPEIRALQDAYLLMEEQRQQDEQHMMVCMGADMLKLTASGSGIRKNRPGASWIGQLYILIRRGWTNQLRDSLMLWGNLVEVLVVGFVFGAIFFQLDQDLAGVLTRRAALYMSAAIQTYLQVIFIVYRTCTDLKVFDRERADRMYDVVPYVFGQFIAQLPFNTIFPAIFGAIMYFMIGFRSDDLAVHLFRFLLSNVLGNYVVVGYGLFSASVARDFATASLVANSLFTFFTFSAGYFIQLDSIPAGTLRH
ncbi:hypothetical protein HDU91_000908 [Kappamyces sp. JEL0680]|nr:hypothetical protein HDU91_000908 [Kappamyces sp. JEL0680]